MHILMIPSWYSSTLTPHTGGFFRQHAHSLIGRGNQVGVAYFEGRSIRYLSPKAVRENHFQITDSVDGGLQTVRIKGWNPLAQTARGAKLWALLCERAALKYIDIHGKPDVVHAQSGIWAGVAAARLRSRLGIPFVLTEHSSMVLSQSLSPALADVYSRMAHQATRLSAVSGALAQQLSELTSISKVSVIPNCIDYSFWSQARRMNTDTRPRVLAVGNLLDVKGFDVLLRAFRSVRRTLPSALLTIVGSGPLRSELMRLSDELGLTGSVEFTGLVDKDRLRIEYSAASCFVCSSRFETFGVAPLEALACGTPVVSTQCGGPEEFIASPSGLLVPKEKPEQLSDAIVAMISGDRPRMQEHARSVASRYSLEIVGAKLEDELCAAAIEGRANSSTDSSKGGLQKAR